MRAAIGKPQYRFTLQPHNFADYEEMCHFHQTSPESHFTSGPRLLSRPPQTAASR